MTTIDWLRNKGDILVEEIVDEVARIERWRHSDGLAELSQVCTALSERLAAEAGALLETSERIAREDAEPGPWPGVDTLAEYRDAVS